MNNIFNKEYFSELIKGRINVKFIDDNGNKKYLYQNVTLENCDDDSIRVSYFNKDGTQQIKKYINYDKILFVEKSYSNSLQHGIKEIKEIGGKNKKTKKQKNKKTKKQKNKKTKKQKNIYKISYYKFFQR
jgi:hypothetical protein